jgi:hypothetical protein
VRPAGDLSRAPDDADRFRYQVFLPDAARWFRTSFADFPKHRGYLKADSARTRVLRDSYRARVQNQPVIGISWRTAVNAKVSALKTLSLLDWGPILAGRRVLFVDLQYGNLINEVNESVQRLGANIFHDERIDPVADVEGFAAQVAAMDLVITTSNATAHMAGSLNVPVWTLVPRGFGAMWHWFQDRTDSPWYPSMRIFRQREQGKWKPVLAEAQTALSEFTAAWRA